MPALYTVRVASWSKDQTAISALRTRVFVEEQGVPIELELDGRDADCKFVVAENSQHEVIGTGRMLSDGHIGRLAVDRRYRGQGVGAALLEKLIEVAIASSYDEVDLNAQEHALGFYEKFGFVAEGEVFLDAGIRHRSMRRRVP